MDKEAPRLDTAKAIANLSGDRELYAQVADAFFEDMPNQLASLDAALATLDFITAHRVAHTIKGMAAAVGAERLRSAALALEQACSAAAEAAIAAADPAMREEYAAVSIELREFLASN
jgi:HPt (histidine-containing phosphotransfer) domain-containing protein